MKSPFQCNVATPGERQPFYAPPSPVAALLLLRLPMRAIVTAGPAAARIMQR